MAGDGTGIEDPILPTEVLLRKRVQEMAVNGEDPPPQYICKEGVTYPVDTCTTSPIPIIDLSLVSASSETELDKLKSALCSWGCFLGIGHGVPFSLLDGLLKVTKEFFELPLEEKNKHEKAVADLYGYGGGPPPGEGQPLNWQDRLLIDVYPLDKRIPKQWPQTPTSFRDILSEYTENMKMLTDLILRAMAKSLNLEENCFLDQFGERAELCARITHYPSCPRPDLVIGLRAHTDGPAFTIILQDEAGLQFLKDDKWFLVPNPPHALVVNMGDQMEIMTNGIFKSPVHRVVTNSVKERISVTMFSIPEAGKEIGPEDALVSEEKPQLFKNVTDYVETQWDYYQQGGICALDNARI